MRLHPNGPPLRTGTQAPKPSNIQALDVSASSPRGGAARWTAVPAENLEHGGHGQGHDSQSGVSRAHVNCGACYSGGRQGADIVGRHVRGQGGAAVWDSGTLPPEGSASREARGAYASSVAALPGCAGPAVG